MSSTPVDPKLELAAVLSNATSGPDAPPANSYDVELYRLAMAKMTAPAVQPLPPDSNHLGHTLREGDAQYVPMEFAPDGRPKTGLIINFLTEHITGAELKDIFGGIGEVSQSKVITKNGQAQGYGFVHYTDGRHSHKAINTLNGLQLHGKAIKVSYARLQGHEGAQAFTLEMENPGLEPSTNLIVNFLPQDMTSEEMQKLFAEFGEVKLAKVISKNGESMGYGFIDYGQIAEATKAIENLNGTMVRDKRIKVAYAKKKDGSSATGTLPTIPIELDLQGNPKTCVIVNYLPPEYGDLQLRTLFNQEVGGVTMCNVVKCADGITGKGFGFVHFRTGAITARAISIMNGKDIQGRPIKVWWSKDKIEKAMEASNGGPMRSVSGTGQHRYNPVAGSTGLLGRHMPAAITQGQTGYAQGYAYGYGTGSELTGSYGHSGGTTAYGRQAAGYSSSISAAHAAPAAAAPTGSGSGAPPSHELFVFNLPPDATDASLYKMFGPYGAVHSVKMAAGKGYGFVTMGDVDVATYALQALNGQKVDGRTLQVSYQRAKNK